MALPATEAPRRPPIALGALLHPTKARGELALRLALICSLTTLATAYYRTPEPALTAYIVFFLNRTERTTSIIFNVALVVLVTIVLALVLFVAILVIDSAAWRVAAMALASIAFLFLASASKLRPVGPILAMIVAYALDLLGLVPLGELATRGLLYAWLFIAVPAGVSLAVNLLIAPSPRRLAEKAIADRLRSAAARLIERTDADARAFDERRDAGVGEVLKHLHLARLEHSVSEADRARLEAAAHSTTTILFLVDAIRREESIPLDWRADAATTFEEMAAILDRNGYPIDIALRSGVDAPLPQPRAEALMRDLAGVLGSFSDPLAGPAHAAKKSGFFLPDAFSSAEHVQYALKTTAAAMSCYLLYVLLDWPGIHTCFITCYIVALGSTAETVQKLGLRILGCLAGAALGTAALVWVVPALDSIWGLLAVVFAGSLIGAWVAAGSARVSYAGFQFAFAFFLCVIQGAGPAFDLTIARDRVIGVLIGNAVTYLVFTRLWPVSLSGRIEEAFGALLAELSRIGRMPVAARRTHVASIQSLVAGIGSDLQLLRYEPDTIRPSSGWLDARGDAVRAATRLEAPIVLDGDTRFWVFLSDRIERVSEGFVVGSDHLHPPIAPSDDGPLPTNGLQSHAREQVLVLENSLAAPR